MALTSLVVLIAFLPFLVPVSQTTTAPAAPPLPEDLYGLWTVAPAIVAIGMAILLRQVFPAMIMGILTASAMVMYCLPPEAKFGGANGFVTAARLAIERYLVGAIADPSHSGTADPARMMTVLASLTISGMVAVIHANGGTAAMVRAVSGLARTRRRGQLTTFLAGLVVFFDDYSNCLIIGPTMRPITDRLRISREKLSFILDATAAPVASLALFGTWITTEVSFIQTGLDQLKSDGHLPAFLADVGAYEAFVRSLPYRYYAIFTLVLVFLLGWTGRDFGPMRKAEEREAARATPFQEEHRITAHDRAKWWYAGLPVGGLVVATVLILFLTGWYGSAEPRTMADILKNVNAYAAILYGAIISVLLAIGLSVATRSLTFMRSLESMMEGVQRVIPAIAILIFAWALSDSMRDLHLGQVAVRELKSHQFSPHLLPLMIFVAACIVSFATGTSWGTMGILCPVAVLLAGHLATDLARDDALTLFYGSVGSVLAGAVFGDHCSPISDTTVLSALASECSLEAHVWTQLPYAVTAALMEIVAGDLLCGWLGAPAWVGLLTGSAGLVVIVYAIGRPIRERAAVVA
ncbi:MAG TPA: Na+/H+ antiporter NhaC family protein [Phycisphaerae bacterium]|nr:Na+/H+ antiporter NhaC family protein [Phycisphaerae bacterium]